MNIAIGHLSALAQDSRLAIFRILVQAGPDGMAAGAIAEDLGLPPNTLSFHIRRLEQAGLVHSRRDGRQIFYRAEFDAMNSLIGYLTENCCGGDRCESTTPGTTAARRPA